MSRIIRLPANSQAYVKVLRDGNQGTFDAKLMRYGYVNPPAFPAAWAYWKLNEASGSRLDSSGNGRHLTPQGTTLPDSAAGVLGDAAHFTGSNLVQNRLELSECWNPADDAKFTYSFWVKSPAVDGSSYSSFILTSNLSVTIQGAYGFYGSDGLIVTVNTEDPWNLWIGGDPGVYLLPDDTWHHFFIVYDGVGLYVCVDNVLEMSATGTHGMTDNMNIVKFGMPDMTGVESWAQHFGIWTSALTSAQGSQLFNSGAGWSPY